MAITSNFFGLNLFSNVYSSTNDLGLNIRLELTYSDPIFTTYDKSNLKFILDNTTLNTSYQFNYILDKYYGYSSHYIPMSFKNYINNDFENNILEYSGNTSAFTFVEGIINNYNYYVYLNYFIDGIEYNTLLSSSTFDVQFFEFNTSLHNNLTYVIEKYQHPLNLSNNKNYIDLDYGLDKNIILYLYNDISTLQLYHYDKYDTNYKNEFITVDYSGIGYYIYRLDTNNIEQRTNYLLLNDIRLNLRKYYSNTDDTIYIAEYDTKFNSISTFLFEGKTDVYDVNSKLGIVNNNFIAYDTVQYLSSLTNNYILNYNVEKNYEKTSINRYDCNTVFLNNYTYLDETYKELALSKNVKLKEYIVETNSAVTYYNGEPVEIIGKLIDFTNLTDFTGDADNIYVDNKWLINAEQDNWIAIFNVLPVITTPTTVNLRIKYYYENNQSVYIRMYYFWNGDIYKILYFNDLQNGVDIGGGLKEINTIITGYTFNQVAQFRIESLILSGDIDLYIDEVAVIYTGITQNTLVDYYDKLIPTGNEYDVVVEDGNYTLLNEESDSLISYNVKFRDKNKIYRNYDIK